MISIKEHGGWLASRSIMRSSFVTLFLLHNKLLQVANWLGSWTVFLSRVLTTSKHQCVDLRFVCVSGCFRCSVFWEYPMYPNMVSKRLWRVASDFDQDLEPVLPKLWNGFWFYILCAFLAYESCSIASVAPFPLGNSFRFIENCVSLFQKHPFRQIWMYNVTVTDFVLFIFRSLIFYQFYY